MSEGNLVMSTIQIQYSLNQDGHPVMHVLYNTEESILTTIGLLEMAKQYIMMGEESDDE